MTSPKQLVVVLAAIAWTACNGSGGKDAGLDAALNDGAGDSETCATPLAGTAPFSAHLKASGTLFSPYRNSPRPVGLDLDIYFADGRVAGAPVLLAMPVQYAVPALQVGAQIALAADLSATGLTVEGGLGVLVNGTLLPADDGMSAAVTANLSLGTDVADDATGVLKFCPTGPGPAPSLAVRPLSSASTLLAPTSTVLLNPTTPIDATARTKIKLYAGDTEVPVTVVIGTALESSPLLLTATAAFPPEAALRLDTTAVTDILGRPVPSSGSLQPLTTTATVSDLTFATAPTGAVATTGSSQVTDGNLVLGNTGNSGGFNALLALGSVAPATQARLRVGVTCTVAGSPATGPSALVTRASLVGAVGASVAVPLACGSPQDVTVPLPASTGKIWLSVVSEPPPQHPQFLPYPLSNSVQIDEIVFE